MQILFIGQKAVTGRVEALAVELAKMGHQVSATTAQAGLRNYQGVKLIYRPSLDPQKPGGLLYNLLSLITLWIQQPDVVHAHGWLASSLLRLAKAFSPASTLLLTLDSLPKFTWLAKAVLAFNAPAANAITTPTRQLQYHLLNNLNLPTHYIPDGYTQSALPDLPRKVLGLGRGKYALILTDETKIPSWISRAHKAARLPGKLVISNGFEGRRLTSLIHQAELVIMTGVVPSDVILQAMAAGKPIIATTEPILQETLGVTARFVVPGSTKQLRDALALRSSPQASEGGAKRAKRHFQWTRILPEYLALYHYPATRPVPIDSLVRVQTAQTATR